MSDQSLETRLHLPEHLRLLSAEFPRVRWPELSQMGQLTKFWLERHLMFREILTHLDTDAKAFINKDLSHEQYGPRLYRLASMFVGQLHEHHHVEDSHYFPLLTKLDPRMEASFDLLETDHSDIDGLLNAFTEKTNAVLMGLKNGKPDMSDVGEFHSAATRFENLLDRHLLDEEEIIVPVLLKYGEESLYGNM